MARTLSLHDSFCTPKRITRLLPIVDYDPCSNPRSTVKSRRSSMLERGENGLLTSWRELIVFVNGPFSNLLPWATKIHEARAFGFLCNADPSTKWWRKATEWPCWVLLFGYRIPFDPPPGLEPEEITGNDRPQALICSDEFRLLCSDRFRNHGDWWRKR